jgi:hypothetical protein
MTSTLNFDEKKFWIVLFSIVARREAMREPAIERADEPQKQQERRYPQGSMARGQAGKFHAGFR